MLNVIFPGNNHMESTSSSNERPIVSDFNGGSDTSRHGNTRTTRTSLRVPNPPRHISVCTGSKPVIPSGFGFHHRPPKVVDGRRIGQKPVNALFDRSRKFPHKLWLAAHSEGCSIFRWSENGCTLLVCEKEFEDHVMTKYPDLVQVPSFVNFRRQLREYGFEWHINSVNDEFEFHHPLFSRDNPKIIPKLHIRRRYPNGNKLRNEKKPFEFSSAHPNVTVSRGIDKMIGNTTCSSQTKPSMSSLDKSKQGVISMPSSATPTILVKQQSSPLPYVQWETLAKMCNMALAAGDSNKQFNVTKQLGACQQHHQPFHAHDVTEQIGAREQQHTNSDHLLDQQYQQEQTHAINYEANNSSMHGGSALVMQPTIQSNWQQQMFHERFISDQMAEKQKYLNEYDDQQITQQYHATHLQSLSLEQQMHVPKYHLQEHQQQAAFNDTQEPFSFEFQAPSNLQDILHSCSTNTSTNTMAMICKSQTNSLPLSPGTGTLSPVPNVFSESFQRSNIDHHMFGIPIPASSTDSPCEDNSTVPLQSRNNFTPMVHVIVNDMDSTTENITRAYLTREMLGITAYSS